MKEKIGFFWQNHNIRLFILLSALTIVYITGGVFYWQFINRQKVIAITPTATPGSTPQYPKVTTWQVPILMYHYIRNAEGESEMGKNLSVSPQNFDQQLKWLKENNFETLRVADLADEEKIALSKIVYEKKKPIILTLDDGYLDAYTEALPVLKKYNMIATFYIIRDYVGRTNYMGQEQIDELKKSGMEIGSHSLSHPNLSNVGDQEANRQIFESKSDAITFCYPGGRYDSETIDLLQQAGYKAAVTTHFGIADEGSSVLELPRVRVENGSGATLGYKIEAAFE